MSVSQNEYKTKSEDKNTTNKYRYFLESNFVGVNRLTQTKTTVQKSRRFCSPKGVVKNYNVIINGKNFYDEPINSDIKPYKEIRKLTTGQEEDYTTGCLLGYEYIKNYLQTICS